MFNVDVGLQLLIRDHLCARMYGERWDNLGPISRQQVNNRRDTIIVQLNSGSIDWPDYLGPEPIQYMTERIDWGRRRDDRARVGIVLDEFDAMAPAAQAIRGAARPIPRPIIGNPLAGGEVTRRPVVRHVASSTVQQVWTTVSGVPAARRENFTLSEKPVTGFPYDHCVGVEIEVEAVVHGDTEARRKVNELFEVTVDGSLRGAHAYEYVTFLGTKAADFLAYLPFLEKSWQSKDFSFRCGVHVHVDVTNHTLEDLYKVFMIYSVVEPLIFAVSGNRTENKFCVAVQESHNSCASAMHYGHERDWPQVVDSINRGTKYMGMNILPIRRYNTIEFRHHEGTSDVQTLGRWLTLLLDLVVHCKGLQTEEIERDILKMNTDSQYILFLRKCFPNSERMLTAVPDFAKKMYAGVAFVKECFAQDPQTAGQLAAEEDF